MYNLNSLPKNFEKTINELARAREKAAKQKYLLDLGESLVMHLCAFVLGEYKNSGEVSIELEKSFLKNNKNVSFGIYLGWLRESSKFLNQAKKPSGIHNLLHGNNDFTELWRFIKMFDALKTHVESESSDPYQASVEKLISGNSGKSNLLQFFDSFIQLRNRVAHPHKEVKGKMVTWPFTEDYFNITNPFLENALNRIIGELGAIWEYRQYVVDSNQDGLLTLLREDSNDREELELKTDFMDGVKVFANPEKNVLHAEWKSLLKAGEKAIEEIKREEDELRNRASVEVLKESIRAALDDGQISLEEMNFFESLGKTKLGITKSEIKTLILEVAQTMGIENPFPEVDKRFVEAIDNAISNRTYDEFVLKLTGQQYGVDAEMFEKVFLERTFILNVDPEEVRRNKVLQFTTEEMNALMGLVKAQQWLVNLNLFNHHAKQSVYKISGDSNTFGTKEYWQKTSFSAIENFVKLRLEKLSITEELTWDANQNNWQIGTMTGYAWCSIYPKNADTGKLLALHLSLYRDGFSAVGFLPDWKDFRIIENYGLLLNVFNQHLKDFGMTYRDDLKEYPNLFIWDAVNNSGYHSFSEILSGHPWYIDYIYGLDQIQFVRSGKENSESFVPLIESFDIIFNLFNGLFEGVNRDYKNMLDKEYLISTHEKEIRKVLLNLNSCFEKFGLAEPVESEKENKKDQTEEPEIQEQDQSMSSDGLSGSLKHGYFFKQFRQKIKGYPLIFTAQIRQDYYKNSLNLIIHLSCAGYKEESIHRPVERILESMAGITFPDIGVYFLRSKLLLVKPIQNISEFDATDLMESFLQELSTRFAFAGTPFLGLKVFNPLFNSYLPLANKTLDAIALAVKSLFSNNIHQTRNLMKKYRYIDHVYSNSKFYRWLGWGLFFEENNIKSGITFHISNSLTGAGLVGYAEQYAKENPDWKMISNEGISQEEASWIGMDITKHKLSASSDYSRNYSVQHAFIDNPKSYWCAKIKDDKQWIQIQFDNPVEIHAFRLQGTHNPKEFVREYHLKYSLDGKTWQEILNIEGLASANETRDFKPEEKIRASFFRVIPVKFDSYPALRFDLLTRPISPSQVELQWRHIIQSDATLENSMLQIPEKISGFMAFMNGKTGF